MRIIAILILLFLQSCASLGPKFTHSEIVVPKNKSIMTIYRPWKFAGSVGDPYTCLDNKTVGEYYNGTFYNLEISPGEHYVSWGMIDGQSKMGVKFEAKAGEQYFLRFESAKLIGAKESTQGAAMGGAGVIGYLAVGALFSKNSAETIQKMVDERVQKVVNNQGLMFVKKEYALTELKDTKEYMIKKYDTSWCNPPK